MAFLGDTEVRDFTQYRHYDRLDDDFRQDVTFSHSGHRLQVHDHHYQSSDDEPDEGELYRRQVARQQEEREAQEEREHPQPSVEHGHDPFKSSHRHVKKIWYFIGRCFANPVVSLCTLILCILAITLLVWHALAHYEKPIIDISLDAFQIPNHPSSLRQDMVDTAIKDLSSRHKREIELLDEFTYSNKDRWKKSIKTLHERFTNMEMMYSDHERTERDVVLKYRVPRWKMDIVYLAKGHEHDNVFTPDRLQTIHKIEQKITEHARYKDFCVRNRESVEDEALGAIYHCHPVNSLMTYFFPSEISGRVVYDGMGSNLADINGSLTKAMAHSTFYWYVDENMSKNNLKSKLLRSQVMFGTPTGDGFWPDGRRKTQEEQHTEFLEFLVSYADMLDKSSTKSLTVLYGGNELFDWQVQQTFYHDISMASISGGLIFILVFVLTSFSLWLTITGFISIGMSFGLAFFLYRVTFGYESFGILNGASVFVVIGIGVDDVFVFINTFRQSKHIEKLYERMAFTIRTAGTATLFTSFTTAAAFGANATSQIPAIHDFGLFMALLISSCWVTVVLIMPPALCLWHYAFGPCEQCVFKLCSPKTVPESNQPSQNLYAVLINYQQQPRQPQIQPSVRQGNTLDDGDDSDIPMLDIDDSGVDMSALQSDDDVPLVNLSNSPNLSPVAIDNNTGCGMTTLTSFLQQCLYKKIGLPMIKGRYIIAITYICVLITSIALLSQLKPASKPPELFQENTNLQQLINVAFNYSGDDIQCDRCSGLFLEDPDKLPTGPTQPAVIIPTRSDDDDTPTTKRYIQPVVTTLSPTTATPPHVTCKDLKLLCQFDGRCKEKMDGLNAACDCEHIRQKCKSEKDNPQCTSTGVTFQTKCHVDYQECLDQSNIVITHPGPCHSDTPPPVDPHHGNNPHSVTDRPIIHTPKTHNGGSGGDGKPLPTQASPNTGFNPCGKDGCAPAADRPMINNFGAMVFVVFGISGIDRSNLTGKHVIDEDKGSVIYGKPLDLLDQKVVSQLCTICKNIANYNTPRLVKEGGAQCIPSSYGKEIELFISANSACKDLPTVKLLPHEKSHAMVARDNGGDYNLIKWYAMAFESTTNEGKSSFSAYSDYLEWEKLIDAEMKKLPEDSPLQNAFQTSDFWKVVFMEVLGVSSAIYGLIFSLVVCVVSVAVFTAHVGLLAVVMLTIIGVIFFVVGLFFVFGWEMGAVEALSLSILVGSSVDYCAHLVEGYLLAGAFLPTNLHKNKERRQWRTGAAISHIGVSILSSALTTIIAAIPLCIATIKPFSKFGEIVALNTFISIIYTLTACVSFLSIFGPAKYTWNVKWMVITLVIVTFILGGLVAAAYVAFVLGIPIPGPTGESLFPK